ncbi:hypothetical protein FOA52_000705 [Chlamydomonas sp. UWO 241]|nr:hypothetical protein FOA52_000705 [Chlamydomonas sp. UWO 241]
MDQLIKQFAGAQLQSVVGPVRDVGQLSAAQLADLRSATVCAPTARASGFRGARLAWLRCSRSCSRIRGLSMVHDTKMDVDALHHLLNIRLVNVHDTQAWDQVLTRNRSNLSDTLVRYGCPPNRERDRNLYVGNHEVWATRPLTQRLSDYASGDVQLLFQLRKQQLSVAARTPGAEARCVQASRQAAQFFKKVLTTTKISEVGRFIGSGGSNIASLSAQMPGFVYQIRDSGPHLDNLLVYADDAEQLAKAAQAPRSARPPPVRFSEILLFFAHMGRPLSVLMSHAMMTGMRD